jgi:hypothetical protein
VCLGEAIIPRRAGEVKRNWHKFVKKIR